MLYILSDKVISIYAVLLCGHRVYFRAARSNLLISEKKNGLRDSAEAWFQGKRDT